MKIAVLGAAGKMALSAILDLAENNDVKSIVLIDIDIKELKVRKRINPEKIIIKPLDINNDSNLIALLDNCDVCINCISHHYNLKAMDACLKSKTNYTDLGGLFHWARKQLEFHDKFVDRGITGIVGSGSAPGIVNVMARYGYDMLENVDTVKILDGIVNLSPEGVGFSVPYAIDTILDEFTANAYEYKGGEFFEISPFSGAEEIIFPEPVGCQTVYSTLHSEVATIPISFKRKGIKNVAFKLALPKAFEERLRFLVDLGLGSKEPLNINTTKIVPRDVLMVLVAKKEKEKAVFKNKKYNDHKALKVEVFGRSEGKQKKITLETVIHPYEKWPISMGVFSVGFPASVTARLLASGAIRTKGFFASESVIEPKIYFNELSKRDIKITVHYSEEI